MGYYDGATWGIFPFGSKKILKFHTCLNLHEGIFAPLPFAKE